MESIKEYYEKNLRYVTKRLDNLQIKQRNLILVGLVLFLLVLIGVTVVPGVRASIRQTQLSTTVTNEIVDNKHFLPVKYDEVTDLILSQEEVTLLLVDSKSEKMYTKLKEIVHDKDNDVLMTQPIYVYPLVYNKEELTNFFRLKSDVTLLHFSNQAEKYRVEFESLEELTFHFMDFVQDIEIISQEND